jgi:geranylgeranyl transferase type-2 subunit alpha
MLHGQKKVKRPELTEEEKAKNTKKLESISKINKTMIENRHSKRYDEKMLEQTMKFSSLSPDFTTLWNYRREILTHLFATAEGKFATPALQME